MTARFVALVVVLATSAHATELTLSFPQALRDGTVEFRQLRRAADYAAPPSMVRKVAAGSAVTVDLLPGHWALDVVSETMWHQTQTFSIGTAPSMIDVRLWPAATLTGHVAMRDKSDVPPELRITFVSRDGSVPNSEATCPVKDDTFTCRLPAGLLDLRIRAARCIPTFLWKQHLTSSRPLDIGRITLAQGASLIGRIEVARGVNLKLEAIHVTATPAEMSPTSGTFTLAATKLVPVTAMVGPNGLFHMDGIAPGEYTIVASGGAKLRSQRVRIVIKPATMADMHDALKVQPPKTLRVLLSPFLDTLNQPWRVELLRQVTRRDAQPVTASLASTTGEWSAANLIADTYQLKIMASDGSEWHDERVEISDSDVTIPVALASRQLHGLVTLGGKPLAADIELRDAASSLAFTSDERGRFEGAVPFASAEWTVVVKADQPAIRYKAKGVRAQRRENSSDVDLPIRLPNTAIMGTVVDGKGNPFEALVNVNGPLGLEQVRTAADGSFFVAGLAPGRYGVEASAFLKQSKPVDVTLADDSAPEPLRLVLEDVEQVHGRVASDFGPVAGAEVIVTPANIRARMVDIQWTDPAGEFSTFAIHGTRTIDVLVVAPGYAVKFFRTELREGMLMIPVDQRGGSLRVPKPTGTRAPFLIHNGAIESVEGMLWDAAAREEAESLFVPAIDPGPYSLCMLSGEEAVRVRQFSTRPTGPCVSAFLPPFGAVAFDAPHQRPDR